MTADLLLEITLRLEGAGKLADAPGGTKTLEAQFAQALKMIAPMLPGGGKAKVEVKARKAED